MVDINSLDIEESIQVLVEADIHNQDMHKKVAKLVHSMEAMGKC